MSTSKKKLGPRAHKKLSERQRIFCEQYIITGIQEEALRAAGYSECANQRLMDNPLVVAEIARLRAERVKRCQLDADAVLRELCRMAMVNVADLFNDDWSLKRKSELTEDQQRAIVGVKRKSTTTVLSVNEGDDETTTVSDVELKTAKEGKLSEALKHLGLLVEKHEVSGTVTLEQLMPQSKFK